MHCSRVMECSKPCTSTAAIGTCTAIIDTSAATIDTSTASIELTLLRQIW